MISVPAGPDAGNTVCMRIAATSTPLSPFPILAVHPGVWVVARYLHHFRLAPPGLYFVWHYSTGALLLLTTRYSTPWLISPGTRSHAFLSTAVCEF